MVSNPKHGWCDFTLGSFKGVASYLTDVPLDLLDAFINYHKKGTGVVVFDEEGSYFTLLLTEYNSGIFIIEERDEVVLHDFLNLNIDDLERELISDIESDLRGWSEFLSIGLKSQIQYIDDIKHRISELKKYIQ